MAENEILSSYRTIQQPTQHTHEHSPAPAIRSLLNLCNYNLIHKLQPAKWTLLTVRYEVAWISTSGNANHVCHLSHYLQQTTDKFVDYYEGYLQFLQAVCGCALCSMFILCGTIKNKTMILHVVCLSTSGSYIYSSIW